MDREKIVAAFNEWMRLYTEEPEKFESSLRGALDYLRARADGETPTYGERCAALLEKLAAGQ